MNSKAVSVCARGFAAQAAQKVAPAAQQEGLKTTTLPNGVVVASAPADLPVSRVAIALRVGSRDESYENRGVSHVLRTVTGLSTKGATGFGLTRTLNQAGASLNCTGGRESTIYVLDCLQNNINGLLPLLAEVSLRPALKPWEVTDNIPRLQLELSRATNEAKLLDLLHQAAFRFGLGNTVLCPSDVVGKTNEKHLESFIAENYAAGKAAVVGLGVNHIQLVDFAQSLNFPNGGKQSPASKFHTGERRIDAKGKLAYAAIAGSGASLADPKTALVHAVLQRVLGDGPATKRGTGCGTLVKALGDHHASVSALNVNYSDAGLFGLFAVADAGIMDKVLSASLKAFKSTKVEQGDLARGKALLKMDLLEAENSSARLVEELAQQAVLRGANIMTANDLIQLVDSVTVDDVNKALQAVAGGKMAMAAIGNLKTTPFLDEL